MNIMCMGDELHGKNNFHPSSSTQRSLKIFDNKIEHTLRP